MKRAEIWAVCWLNNLKIYTKMDLEKTYYKHKVIFIEDSEYWIISLEPTNPVYSSPCWMIPKADAKYFHFY